MLKRPDLQIKLASGELNKRSVSVQIILREAFSAIAGKELFAEFPGFLEMQGFDKYKSRSLPAFHCYRNLPKFVNTCLVLLRRRFDVESTVRVDCKS